MRSAPTDEVGTVIYGKIEITNEDESVVVLSPDDRRHRASWALGDA